MSSTIGTFGSFTIARLGIYASQTGLNVTGNNISNINTTGYTRQALDQVSFKAGGSDRYASQYSIRTGQGALVTGVSQLRDPYLDIRYRSEMSSVGAMDSKLAGLESISAILDEVGENSGDGVIEAQLSDLLATLENLSVNTNQSEADAQVRSSASALCILLNSYAKQLQEVESNTIKQLDQDVEAINNILESIRDLNSSIRKSEIHGDRALELRDERNLLIDELSQYMKIDVTYEEEDIGAGLTVEKLVIKLGNANPDDTVPTDTATLVDGVYATQISVDKDDNYNVSLDQLKDAKGRVIKDAAGNEVPAVGELDDNDLYGALQSTREILTEAGEFCTRAQLRADENAAAKRGLPYYMKSLDLLANQIAEKFNEANNGTNSDGTDNQYAGNLFSNSGDEDSDRGITAANISVAYSWSKGDVQVVNSYQVDDATGEIPSTKNDNILHMVALMSTKFEFRPGQLPNIGNADNSVMFEGTFQEMLTNISAVLGNDIQSTSTMLDTYYTTSVELDTSRDGVAGVDLNDEAMNLMQYQKSYSAACRLLTALDESLDKLINGTGVVGR